MIVKNPAATGHSTKAVATNETAAPLNDPSIRSDNPIIYRHRPYRVSISSEHYHQQRLEREVDRYACLLESLLLQEAQEEMQDPGIWRFGDIANSKKALRHSETALRQL